MKPLPLCTGPARASDSRPVVLLHADGKLPNLALMRLGTYFRERGRAVSLVRPGEARASLFEREVEAYGSSIFEFSGRVRAHLDAEWGPGVRWGGTGVRVESSLAEVEPGIAWDEVAPDYTLYPDFRFSLGFSQRGCRLRCPWCVVPRKEGAARAVGTVASIWRGPGHPRSIVLLDNDPFGVPEWPNLIREIREGGFKVSFSQGINVRLIGDEHAAALASIEYRDNEFQSRTLYTAWDNLRDEGIFREGVERLGRAGVPAKHLRVYMLIGFRPDETFGEIQYRFAAMVGMGCEPYPMVFDNTRRPEGLPADRTLKHFQRWAITGLYRAIPFEKYDPHIKAHRSAEARAEEAA